MKKIINNPTNIVDELIDGFVAARNDKVERIGKYTIVARKNIPIDNKVSIVIGGGSGHEPLFIGYVGKGMADIAVQGEVFAAPSSKNILEAIKVGNGKKGVILLYCNYAGDVLNFNMAQEIARDEGIKVDTVLINDDISSAPKEEKEDRRGTTATPVIIKIAGSASETGMEFESLKKLIQKAIDNSRSLGVSLSGCTLPETGIATFTLEEGKMEFGMGLHGEAGIKKVDLMNADDTAKTILDLLIEDLPYKKGDEVVLLINGYGSTSLMEMFIINLACHNYLKGKGIAIHSTEVGEFCTSQEMAGVSISLIKLDNELKKFYDMPSDSLSYKRI